MDMTTDTDTDTDTRKDLDEQTKEVAITRVTQFIARGVEMAISDSMRRFNTADGIATTIAFISLVNVVNGIIAQYSQKDRTIKYDELMDFFLKAKAAAEAVTPKVEGENVSTH
jgi:hypothetical protein